MIRGLAPFRLVLITFFVTPLLATQVMAAQPGPTPVTATAGVPELSIGNFAGCGVSDAEVISCWGNDSYALAEPPDDAYLSVSVGTYAACGVNALHELRCWGLHLAGVDNAPSGSFREVKVSRGVHDSCAIHTDGSVACWNWDNTAAVPPADTLPGSPSAHAMRVA